MSTHELFISFSVRYYVVSVDDFICCFCFFFYADFAKIEGLALFVQLKILFSIV